MAKVKEFSTTLKRKKGRLYYVKKDGKGNLCVYSAPMKRKK